YSGILLDPYPRADDVERLYIATHALAGTSASYGFPLFAEISGKLAHIFQYAMNSIISAEAAAPLVEFISEAVALLESDLIMISTTMTEAADDISGFKLRSPFAFQPPVVPPPEPERMTAEPEAQPVAETILGEPPSAEQATPAIEETPVAIASELPAEP